LRPRHVRELATLYVYSHIHAPTLAPPAIAAVP
jgi:hypothetical protein